MSVSVVEMIDTVNAPSFLFTTDSVLSVEVVGVINMSDFDPTLSVLIVIDAVPFSIIDSPTDAV